ncbi:MAG TPA: SMC-Scp complex subunit ScpB [Verrucomicrobiae bacterium]|nr:SMC-Scp complex subunit ScpB [Verrucomicrobiae bacterium]
MPELAQIVEALVFVSDVPVSLDRLCSLLEEYERGDIRQALRNIALSCEGRGIELAEVAGGYQFRSRPDCAEFLKRLGRAKPFRFTQSALETLAIVAYRQPITRAEVEYLRGVDSGGVLKTLLERKLLRILGKKDVPGKPLIYGTSKGFLELFGLKDLTALPTLREIRELAEAAPFEEQQELPLAEAPVEETATEG